MTDTSKATSRHLLINARSAQLNAMGRNAETELQLELEVVVEYKIELIERLRLRCVYVT